MPATLGHDVAALPAHVREVVTKARTSWLKNSEVHDILLNFKAYRLPVGTEAPDCPGGGCLFLFNRKVVRFFRKDGHEWRKKADGKTVRETHEKLKIDNKDALNCYYAHAEAKEALQRRCYWLLDGDADIVLVHYLSSNPAARIAGAAASSASAATRTASEEFSMLSWDPDENLARSGSMPSHFTSELAATAVTITTGRSLMHMGRPRSLPGLENPGCSCQGTAAAPGKLQTSRLEGQSGRAMSLPSSCGEGSTMPRNTAYMSDGPNCSDSIGPLHSAPSFSGATVQTGCTVPHCARQDSRHSSQSGSAVSMSQELGQSPALWEVPSADKRLPGIAAVRVLYGQRGGPNRQPQLANAEQHEWDSFCELKPAASLTRVDSDTLRVAPSLSRATSGANRTNHALHIEPQEISSGRPSLPSSVFSPFYAAAFSGNPIRLPAEQLEEAKSNGLLLNPPSCHQPSADPMRRASGDQMPASQRRKRFRGSSFSMPLDALSSSNPGLHSSQFSSLSRLAVLPDRYSLPKTKPTAMPTSAPWLMRTVNLPSSEETSFLAAEGFASPAESEQAMEAAQPELGRAHEEFPLFWAADGDWDVRF